METRRDAATTAPVIGPADDTALGRIDGADATTAIVPAQALSDTVTTTTLVGIADDARAVTPLVAACRVRIVHAGGD